MKRTTKLWTLNVQCSQWPCSSKVNTWQGWRRLKCDIDCWHAAAARCVHRADSPGGLRQGRRRRRVVPCPVASGRTCGAGTCGSGRHPPCTHCRALYPTLELSTSTRSRHGGRRHTELTRGCCCAAQSIQGCCVTSQPPSLGHISRADLAGPRTCVSSHYRLLVHFTQFNKKN